MLIVLALLGLMVQGMSAQTIKSPDGKILVFLELKDQGKPYYRVNYQGKEVVTPSVLGLKTNIGDFTQGLALKGKAIKHELDSLVSLPFKTKKDSTEIIIRYRQLEMIVRNLKNG